MNEQVQRLIHRIKAELMKKGNCKDIFSTTCDLQMALAKNFKSLKSSQSMLQKQSGSYQGQTTDYQKHTSLQVSQLQQQINLLKKQLLQKDQSLMQTRLSKLQLQTTSIQQKYKGSGGNDDFTRELEGEIKRLQKEVKARDEVIRRMKFSGVGSQATSYVGTVKEGQKVGGYDFRGKTATYQYQQEDRSKDFD